MRAHSNYYRLKLQSKLYARSEFNAAQVKHPPEDILQMRGPFLRVEAMKSTFSRIHRKCKLPVIRICGSLRPFAAVLRAICGGFAGKSGRGFLRF